MLKRITVIAGILLPTALGIYWYLHSKPQPVFTVNDTIKAIPVNTAFILESKNFYSLRGKLDSNQVWKLLLGTEFFTDINSVYRLIDSTSTPDITTCLKNNPIYISAHPTSVKNFDFLFTLDIPANITFSTIDNYIKKISGSVDASVRAYDDATITSLRIGTESVSYSLYKNILILSKNDLLVEDALRQANAQNNLLNDPGFTKVVNASGVQADLHAYFNYKQLPACFKHLFKEENRSLINDLPMFCDWSEFDVSIKHEGVALNGVAYANDSATHFINIFTDQKPQEFRFAKILPENTAFFTAWGISDMKRFEGRYKNYLDSKRKLTIYDMIVKGIKNKYAIDLDLFFNSSFKNEIVYAITQTADKKFYSENSVALFRVKDAEEAAKMLTSWCDTIESSQKIKADTCSYRGYAIRELKITSLLSSLFGDLFKHIEHNRYTFIDDYLVVSNTIPNLKSLINDYENGRTLQNTNRFNAFSDNFSAESNILIYSAIGQSMGLFTDMLADEQSKILQNNTALLNRFDACAIQFSRTDKFIYNNIYFSGNGDINNELKPAWNTELDTTAFTAPFVVVNHKTKQKEIFIQDLHNIVYLVGNDGKIIWRRKLPERIKGKVQQIDAKKNGKLQYLFNTRSSVYLLDRNGDNVEHFPVDLKSPASNSISVFDYDKKKDYRIIIACENKKLYCYNANGENIKQWGNYKTENVVTLPLSHVLTDGKDNLICIDETGKIYVLDRKGVERFTPTESFECRLKNYSVIKRKSIDSSFIIAADSTGAVITILLKGEKKINMFKEFKSPPSYMYTDINSDSIADHVFLSGHELIAFNTKKEVILNYGIKSESSFDPLVFTLNNKSYTGIVSEQTNELFLVNSNGFLQKNFPCYGNGPFVIDDLQKNGQLMLVTPNGKKLTAYLLPSNLE